MWCTVEPLLRGHPDERPAPLERPLDNVNMNINVLISTPEEKPPLLKGHFSDAKGWSHKKGSTVFNSYRSHFKLRSLHEKEITPFRNTFTEIVNAQKAKRCIGGIELCFKVCIILAFVTVIVGSYL